MNFKDCPDCGGSGYVLISPDPDNKGFIYPSLAEDCPKCEGTGKQDVVEMIPIDVPEGYEVRGISKKFNQADFCVATNQGKILKITSFDLPYPQGEEKN
jgi:DnaJ-class molecular chaperone